MHVEKQRCTAQKRNDETMKRSEIKRQARSHLKRHYVLIVLLCAVSIFLGTEFTNVVDNAQTWYDIVTNQPTELRALDAKENRGSLQKIFNDLIEDNLEAGYEETAERVRQLQTQADGNSMLGRSRGVLAALVNNINSGHLYTILITSLHSVIHSRQAAAILMILLALAVQACVWIFLRNVYGVVLRRASLETRIYSAYPLSHLLFLRHVRRWRRASLTMLLVSVQEMLWWITIVGGAIKHYSYFLVPFIAAENPDIRPRQAIRLSRQMMDGHKWECFLLELSYLGWMLLGFVTFGLVQVMWTVPYRVAGYTEFYVAVRAEALERGIQGAELLNDERLYAPAQPEELHRRYSEIARHEAIIEEDIVELAPVQRFFARNFGIWTASLEEKKVFSRQEGLRQRTKVGRRELNSEAYPDRLNPLWKKAANALSGKTSYLMPCTVWSLVVVFFAFCLVGWVWEVSLHLISDGEFVNRGALHGPWLPIYGGGVVMIAVLLYRFRKRPALETVLILVLCGFVEYMTSYFMELSRGMRWWDYTGYFLNLNGRICGEGLAVFCIGGMAAIYLLMPLIDAMVTRIKPKILIPVCIVLIAVFAGDLVYSHFVPNVGKGITDYASAAIPSGGDAAYRVDVAAADDLG